MSYEKNNIVIVTVVSLLFIISSAIVYFVFFFEEPLKDDVKDSIYVKVTDKDIIDELKNIIINNNLIELAKHEKTIDNINTASNEIKLNMSFSKVLKDTNYKYDDKIDATLLDSYFKDNFKDKIYFNKKDILCSCEEKLYIYDEETNSYKYNLEHTAHPIYETYPYYTKVLSVDKKNDIYVIKVSYIWNTYTRDGYTNTGYASYTDSINKQNALFEIEVPSVNYNILNNTDINVDGYAIKEIENNYELYKNKLHKYIYTFEKENDIYKLVSFKFEK